MDAVTIEIIPGQGGEEPQYWAGRLVEMYKAWAVIEGWKIKVRQRHDLWSRLLNLFGKIGHLGGHKIYLRAPLAACLYANLKLEAGVHRFVRRPPHDNQGRRWTSFVAVFVSDKKHPAVLDDDSGPVRSYVFDPHLKAKDHKRNVEWDDPEAILRGHRHYFLDGFPRAKPDKLV